MRPEDDVLLAQLVGIARHVQRIGIELDHRVHIGSVLIEVQDALDVSLGELFGGDFALLHRGFELRHGSFKVVEIVVVIVIRIGWFGEAAHRQCRNEQCHEQAFARNARVHLPLLYSNAHTERGHRIRPLYIWALGENRRAANFLQSGKIREFLVSRVKTERVIQITGRQGREKLLPGNQSRHPRVIRSSFAASPIS